MVSDSSLAELSPGSTLRLNTTVSTGLEASRRFVSDGVTLIESELSTPVVQATEAPGGGADPQGRVDAFDLVNIDVGLNNTGADVPAYDIVIRDPVSVTGVYSVVNVTVRIDGVLQPINESDPLLGTDGVVVIPALLPGEILDVQYTI